MELISSNSFTPFSSPILKNPFENIFGINSETSFEDNRVFFRKDDVNNQDNSTDLTDEEKRVVEELKKRDREVRSHEMAHISAGGSHIKGGINLDYQVGPDGKRYAVGGDVNIDTSREDTPEKTIVKMQTVIRAALAPADPSPQDRRVASEAASKLADAKQELSQQKREESSNSEDLENSAEITVSYIDDIAKNQAHHRYAFEF